MTNRIQVFKFIDDISAYNPQDAFVVKLPSDITSRDQLFKLIYTNLKLPGYFGFNWDALFDCLRDFHWVNEQIIVLIHEALPSLEDKILIIYLRILLDSCLDWKPGEEHSLEVVFPKTEKEKVLSLLNNKKGGAGLD